MEFKLRRLSAQNRLVNAGALLSVILLAAACSGGDKPADSADEPATSPQSAATGSIVELPAVWATTDLDAPVADLALAGGITPMLAVAYEGTGFQLFDLESDRIAESAPYKVVDLAAGHQVEIDDTPLTLFPGITRNGELKAYVYGDGLITPVEVDMGIEAEGLVAGLCSSAPKTDADGLFILGYWTSRSPKTLHTGRVVAVNGELTWLANAPQSTDSEIQTCTLLDGGAQMSGGEIVGSSVLERPGYRATILLSESGALSALPVESDSGLTRLLVSDGISVKMPDTPTSVAALGRALEGGYGGGLIVVGGKTPSGQDQAVFIATDKLTGFESNAPQ